jgi:hypothetical protein
VVIYREPQKNFIRTSVLSVKNLLWGGNPREPYKLAIGHVDQWDDKIRAIMWTSGKSRMQYKHFGSRAPSELKRTDRNFVDSCLVDKNNFHYEKNQRVPLNYRSTELFNQFVERCT